MFALKGRRGGVGTNPQRQGIFRESPNQIKLKDAKSKIKSKPSQQFSFNSRVKSHPTNSHHVSQPQQITNNKNNVNVPISQNNAENIAQTESRNQELILKDRNQQLVERNKAKLLQNKVVQLEKNAIDLARQNDIKQKRQLEMERKKMYDELNRKKLDNERVEKQKQEKIKYANELTIRKQQLQKKSNRQKELIKENSQIINKSTANNLSKAIKHSSKNN